MNVAFPSSTAATRLELVDIFTGCNRFRIQKFSIYTKQKDVARTHKSSIQIRSFFLENLSGSMRRQYALLFNKYAYNFWWLYLIDCFNCSVTVVVCLFCRIPSYFFVERMIFHSYISIHAFFVFFAFLIYL